MELKYIRLINFQCFKDSGEIPIHKMTIFIGENDCGKSSILKALNIALNNQPMSQDIFQEINNKKERTCRIRLGFNVNGKKARDISKEYIINNEITLEKEFSLDEQDNVVTRSLINRYVFEQEELNEINSLKAPVLKDLCSTFSLEYGSVNEAKERLSLYIQQNFETIPKKQGWSEIKWSELSEFLPIFEYYDSSTYGNPRKLIERTLTDVYKSFFYDYDEEGNPKLKRSLVKKREKIIKDLDTRINDSLFSKVKGIIDKVEKISGYHSIDFTSGYQLSDLLIDYGTGLHSINNIGEGSKKRLFLAITEWDKEIRTAEKHRRIIRGYDEPDASLHYSAQKEMFYTLENLSNIPDAKIQIIICTHSISMIDRAPAKVINHVLQNKGISHVEYLKGHDEDGIKEFLDNVSEISGIKNSSLFFERCFLIVEGDTEENALPILYKKVTKKTLTEDGVVLVNLKSNACWDAFLKLLNKNKSDATVLFLDKDTQLDRSRKVTKDKLSQIGFSPEYIETNVIFAGIKEFEDIFSDDLISKCLNHYWPKNDAETWTPAEIKLLRSENKFSKALKDVVEKYRMDHAVTYDHFRKPEFGKRIAELMDDKEILEIKDVSDIIEKVHEIIR